MSLDFEEIQESCHQEYVPDTVVDVSHDHITSFDGCCLTEGKEYPQAGAGDIFKFLTINDKGAIGISL
jgi:hypothetical protein